jgi:uncharacterized membrane protein
MEDSLLIAAMHRATRAIEVAGIVVIVAGIIVASVSYLLEPFGPGTDERFYRSRSRVGRSILLGLEFLVAADIINTVAIEPTLQSLGVLAAIVLIRTFLSFSLEVEIEGRWPWQKSTAGNQEGGKHRPSVRTFPVRTICTPPDLPPVNSIDIGRCALLARRGFFRPA